MESGKFSISNFLWIYTLRDVLNAICLFLENACVSVFFMLAVCMYLLQKKFRTFKRTNEHNSTKVHIMLYLDRNCPVRFDCILLNR